MSDHPRPHLPDEATRHEWEADLFRLLVENVKDYAIFVVDASRHVLTWSAGAEKLLGYSEEEILGRQVDLIFTAPDVAAGEPAREIEAAASTGRGEDDRWHVRKDGSFFWCSGVMTPLRDQHGNLRGYAKIMRDLTEKKLAEDRLVQSEHRFNRLLEANIIGIGITSADGRIKQANGEYLRILGYTRDELEAGTASWADRTPTEHLDLDYKAIAEALSMGACTPYEKEYSRYSDERRVPVLIAFAPLDESKDFIVYVLDLTERKRMEQNLRRANESKDDFIAMLGHELRNPLSPVLTSVHILQSTTGPEKFRDQALSMIERQVKHMTRLVDDLLEVARISKGKFNLKVERLELSFLVTRAIETTRPFIDSRRHRLSVTLPEESIWLRADAVRFEQLLTNLLNNAAKYTEPGGQITVVAQREGGEAVICIRDTGIGIDAATLSRLFVPFSQAEESIGRSMGGLGVGLSLVKKIAELHGGSVHAHSMGVGHGSEFIVRMPIDQAAAAREDQGALEQETHRSMPLRVLVVDDNIDAADSLRMLLELDGHEVVVAHSGPAAVKTAVDWGTPDVILLDIGLPEMDGYQVALTLRSNPQMKGTVLVAMTGYGQESDRDRSQKAGFDAHMVKPVDPDRLSAFLSKAAQRRRWRPAAGA